MKTALFLGFAAMTLLVGLLLWSRARLALAESRLAALQEQAAAEGLEEAA